jgi:hypothetical protein
MSYKPIRISQKSFKDYKVRLMQVQECVLLEEQLMEDGKR